MSRRYVPSLYRTDKFTRFLGTTKLGYTHSHNYKFWNCSEKAASSSLKTLFYSKSESRVEVNTMDKKTRSFFGNMSLLHCNQGWGGPNQWKRYRYSAVPLRNDKNFLQYRGNHLVSFIVFKYNWTKWNPVDLTLQYLKSSSINQSTKAKK